MGNIMTALPTPRLYFPEELWRNSVYSGTLLSYREELRDHMHHKMENERKGTPKECVSTSATADLHMYFFCRSAIKSTFLLNNNNHASMSTNDTRCWIFGCVRTTPTGGVGRRRGVVFLCARIGGELLCGHMLPTRSPQPAYSTSPVLTLPIIQSPEENLILRNPPPCPTPP